MLIADDFVFLHIPKTGGTFVQRVITEHLPRVGAGSYTHTRYDDLPASASALPGFYIVRNPWDWYVSWFHYTQEWGAGRTGRHPPRKPQKAIIWNDLLRSGKARFAETVVRAVRGEYDFAGLFPHLAEPADLYSAYVRDIAGPALDRSAFTAIHFESLRKQLARFLDGRTGVDRNLLRDIRRAPPARTSNHRPYADYYDDALRRLVATGTEWLCDRFGYRFAVAKSPT